jgi:putative ABC transport system substrate-binding protein
MKRREFITLLGGGAAAWPLAAQAQQSERVRRIGVVMAYTERDPNGQIQVGAFRQQLQKLGWIEGTNIQIDFRYAADNPSGRGVAGPGTRSDGVFQPRHNDPSV